MVTDPANWSKETIMETKPSYEELEKRCEALHREIKLQKEMHAALQANTDILKVILEHSNNLFYSHTADHVLTYMSPRTREILDYEPEEALMRWTELVTDHPINSEGFQHTVRAIETGKRQPPYLLQLKGKTGRIVWVEVNESPVVKNGETIAIVGAITDISARKEAEDRLRKSEENFRGFFNNALVGLGRTRIEDGKIIECNTRLARIFGYENVEEFQREFVFSEHYLDSGIREENLAKILKEGELINCEARLSKKDGSEVWVRFYSRLDQERECMEDVVIDITDEKKATVALKNEELRYKRLYSESKKTEELYKSLINSSADAIIIYDLEGSPQYLNPAFTRMFGWRLSDLEGKRIPYVPDSEVEQTSAALNTIMKDNRAVQGFETKRFTQDGRILDVSMSGSCFNNDEGRPAGMLAIIRDISERKKLEKQLLQAQKMEAIGTLAGGIAHDFNNLLMGIQGRASLIGIDLDSGHPHYQHVKEIENYVKSAATLTRNLLGFARGGRYEVKPTDLNDMVSRSVELFGRTKKEITIQKEFQKHIWGVEVDRTQIEQVLLNIYVNAWQAMSGVGTLSLKTSNVILESSFVAPYGVTPGRYVEVSITDTGSGMDEVTLRRVFDPFFTTKGMSRGTGLGLATAYGIIKSHGGIITARSKKGDGSTFSIYLPASDKKIQKVSEPAKAVVRGEGIVLLIDDEEIIIDVGVELLRFLGYSVIAARSGKEALDIYQEKNHEIDIVILDMIMPQMGGDEVFDRLRKINPKARILLSTGYSLNGQAKKIMERGCSGFIQKPFTIDDLSKKLDEINRKGTCE
jgi:PAS domain S-box-containing protein